MFWVNFIFFLSLLWSVQDLFGTELAARGSVLPIGKGRVVKRGEVYYLVLILYLILKFCSKCISCDLFIFFFTYYLFLLRGGWGIVLQ